MTTGQHPQRRETDEQARRRVAELDERRADRFAAAERWIPQNPGPARKRALDALYRLWDRRKI